MKTRHYALAAYLLSFSSCSTLSAAPFTGSFTKLCVATLTFCGMIQNGRTQNPPTSFSITHGGSNRDIGYDIVLTDDGGFVGTGYSRSHISGNSLTLYKYNATNDLEWYVYTNGPNGGISYYEEASAMTKTLDGGYAVIGRENSFTSATDANLVLAKFNGTGHLEFMRSLGQGETDEGEDIVALPDGRLAFVGFTHSYGSVFARNDILLGMLYANGTVEWLRSSNGSRFDSGWGITTTLDGNLAITGETKSFGVGSGSTPIFIAKFDLTGALLWMKTYRGLSRHRGNKIVETPTGNFLVAAALYPAASADIGILKTNSTGGLLWAWQILGAQGDLGYDVASTSDGGGVVVGQYYHPVYGTSAFIAKFSTVGLFEWARLYTGSGVEIAFGVKINSEGEIYMIGYSNSNSFGNNDVLIVKVGADGASDCLLDFTPNMTDVTTTLIVQDVDPLMKDIVTAFNETTVTYQFTEPLHNTTCEVTLAPTNQPTLAPTSPTLDPTQEPSADPTESPTMNPTDSPTVNVPTAATGQPSMSPTRNPSDSPTAATSEPSLSPTRNPSDSPTRNPSDSPTRNPSDSPTRNPSDSPTRNPSDSPTRNPSDSPTRNPSDSPTRNPSDSPTRNPSDSPTRNPSDSPTRNPSDSPTRNPSDSPTRNPSDSPTRNPSDSPTRHPSLSPTEAPTLEPTMEPTMEPTALPTTDPTTSSPLLTFDMMTTSSPGGSGSKGFIKDLKDLFGAGEAGSIAIFVALLTVGTASVGVLSYFLIRWLKARGADSQEEVPGEDLDDEDHLEMQINRGRIYTNEKRGTTLYATVPTEQ